MQRPRRESVLATILFTDIVGSSDFVAELGDRRWKVLLSRHNALVRRELRRHGGRELDTAGDGFFASFETPGNAIRCAAAVVAGVQDLGIDVRIGLHLGQAELLGRKLGGAAVHIGARVMGQAGPAEVLVTGVLRDVLPISDFTFQDRGTQTLKGIPGEWRLFRVTAVEQPLPGPLEPEVAAERRAAVQAPPIWRRRYVPIAIGSATVVGGVVAAALLLTGSDSSRDNPTGARLPPHALVRLNPDTGKIEAVLAIDAPMPPPPLGQGGGRWPGPGPRSIAAGEGSIWITNGGSDSVSRIDPVHARALSIDVSGRPDDVVVGRDGVWVTGADGKLTQIDTGTNETKTIDISVNAPLPVSVAVGNRGEVYIVALACQICGDPIGTVTKFDPSSGSLSVVPAPRHIEATAILFADGRLWMTAGAEVWQVDPGTGKVLKEVRIEEGFGDLAVDPSGASIWVTTVGSGGRVGRAIQIDASTGEIIGGQPIGCCPGAIAVDDDYVWVTNSAEGTVQRISRVTGDVAPPITVGKGVNGIAVGQGGVWVTIDR